MLVPLVTAFSIKLGTPDQKVPRATILVFTSFIGLFITSSILYGIVIHNEDNLNNFGKNIFVSFKEITSANMKETLMYIALTIGLTVKK